MALELNNLWTFETFELDCSERVLRQTGREIALGSRAFDVLERLVQAKGQFVSRSQIKLSVWGMEVGDNAVDRQISDLRGLLGRRPDGRQIVETKYGAGWRIQATREIAVLAPDQQLEVHLQTPSRAGSAGVWLGAAALITMVVIVWIVLLPQKEYEVANVRPLTTDELGKAGPLGYSKARVFFQKIPQIDPRLYYVSEDGGATETLAVPIGNALLLDANPTADRFLIQGYGPGGSKSLFIWSTAIGLSKPFGSPAGPFARMNLRWDKLAFTNAKGLSLQDLERDSLSRTLVTRVEPHSLAWSPESTRIRFSIRDAITEDEAIWEKDIDDSPARRLALVPGSSRTCCGVWHPNGKLFLFQETHEGRSDLWIVDEGRPTFLRSAKRLTNGPISFSYPIFSASGQTIFAVGEATQSELVSFDPNSHLFHPFMGGITASDVSFSGDGRWAAYSSLPDHRLWRSNPDGSARILLVPSAVEAFQPHWSRDGSKICFMGRMPGEPWRAFMVASTGGMPTPVLVESEDQGVPSFSADGLFVIFGRRQLGRAKDKMDIEVVDVAQKKSTILPESQGKWSPRWSPDGNLILAQSTDFKKLFVYDLHAKCWQEVVSMGNTDYAEWSADGRFVYFHGRLPGAKSMSIYRVRIADRKLEKLADHSSGLRIEDTWTGVTPDNSILGLRDAKTSQIYALDLQMN